MNGDGLRYNPPVSIILPSGAVIEGTARGGEMISEIVSDYTSGKVVEDYVSDNIITPLRDTALKFALVYTGFIFILVGLIILALNTTIGKTAVSTATRGVSSQVESAIKGKGKK